MRQEVGSEQNWLILDPNKGRQGWDSKINQQNIDQELFFQLVVQLHGSLNQSKSRVSHSYSPTSLCLYMPDFCFGQALSACGNVWDAK